MKLHLLLLLGALCLPSTLASGAVVIDTFDDLFPVNADSGTPLLFVGGVATSDRTVDSTSQSLLGGVLGGTRSATLSRNEDTTTGHLIVENGLLSFSQPPGPLMTATLSYGPDLNVDLSRQNAFVIDVQSSDFSGANAIELLVDVTSGGNTSSASVLMDNMQSAFRYYVPFADFAGTDFSDVDALTFTFATLSGSPDFSLRSITAVPEPATLALVVICGAGLLAARKRLR